MISCSRPSRAIGWSNNPCGSSSAEHKRTPIGHSQLSADQLSPWLLLRALDMPQVKGVIPVRRIFHILRFERFPVAHIEVVRDNPGTRFHLLPNVWPDQEINLGQ